MFNNPGFTLGDQMHWLIELFHSGTESQVTRRFDASGAVDAGAQAARTVLRAVCDVEGGDAATGARAGWCRGSPLTPARRGRGKDAAAGVGVDVWGAAAECGDAAGGGVVADRQSSGNAGVRGGVPAGGAGAAADVPDGGARAAGLAGAAETEARADAEGAAA